VVEELLVILLLQDLLIQVAAVAQEALAAL
jgi:hypothetical protein